MDSNILLGPGDIAAFAECLGPEVGLVSAIPIARQPVTFSAWIETSIINNYHARVLMLGNTAGLGFGLGKVMLFRRSDLVRAGGLDSLKWAVGEDMALARAMRMLGLRTVLADRLCDQVLENRSFRDVWHRQLRWMTIWRVQLPAVFVVDLLGSALPTAFAGAFAARLVGVSSAGVFAATLVGWCAIESILCAAKGWPHSWRSPLAFFARELLTPALWLRALVNNEVHWAGATYRVRGMTSQDSEFSPKASAVARGRAE
jgi:ceramide glucosyltransferase